jgi:hypothetical protein
MRFVPYIGLLAGSLLAFSEGLPLLGQALFFLAMLYLWAIFVAELRAQIWEHGMTFMALKGLQKDHKFWIGAVLTFGAFVWLIVGSAIQA